MRCVWGPTRRKEKTTQRKEKTTGMLAVAATVSDHQSFDSTAAGMSLEEAE